MTTASTWARSDAAAPTQQRMAAGLSLLFMPQDRIDAAALKTAAGRCQARAYIAEAADGSLEVVLGGLTFEIDGLAPGDPIASALPADRYGFDRNADLEGLKAVRLYPGHHLSGGIALPPVYRALLALSAELAAQLPVRAVCWHPANTLIAPELFTRSTLAWLAGGLFPAPGLVAIEALGQERLGSRGLSHFIGQEVLVTGSARHAAEPLAVHAIDHFVQAGPLDAYTCLTLAGVRLHAEPAKAAKQILVWTEDERSF